MVETELRESIEGVLKKSRSRRVASEFEFFVAAKKKFGSANEAEEFATEMQKEGINCQIGVKNAKEVIRQMRDGDLVPFSFTGPNTAINFISIEKIPSQETATEGARSIFELIGEDPAPAYRLFQSQSHQLKPGDMVAIYGAQLDASFVVPFVNYNREFSILGAKAVLKGQRVSIRTGDLFSPMKGEFAPEGFEHLAEPLLATFQKL